jgi:hypothetical protein
MSLRRLSPPGLHFRELDDAARNGEFWLVRDAQQFAIARWTDTWRCSNGRALPFEPDQYRPKAS